LGILRAGVSAVSKLTQDAFFRTHTHTHTHTHTCELKKRNATLDRGHETTLDARGSSGGGTLKRETGRKIAAAAAAATHQHQQPYGQICRCGCDTWFDSLSPSHLSPISRALNPKDVAALKKPMVYLNSLHRASLRKKTLPPAASGANTS